MARPKAKAAPRFVEPEDESQDPEDQQRLEAEEPDEEPESTGKRMSKTDAIRAAMAEGIESPGDGVDFIKRRFGLDMSKQHFSATKSKLKSTEAAQKASPKSAPKASAPKARAPKAAAKSRPEPVEERQPARPPGGEGDLLSAMEAMKPLVESLGKEQAHRIIDLLG